MNKKTMRAAKFIFVLLVAIIQVYPIAWMVSSSFKPNLEIFSNLTLIPQQFTLENYVNGWVGSSGLSFGIYLSNTFVIVFFSIIGNLISCSCAAYAFGRLNFRFKSVLFAIMFATVMLPQHVVLIPQYVVYSSVNWVNTWLPLIIPRFFAVDVFFTYLITQFIRGIPKELDEAAVVDGCSRFQIFPKILLPLLIPVLATTAIFTFIWTWNDFMSQMIYLNTPDMFTVSQGLRTYIDASSESAYGTMFAMSIVSLIPLFVIFTFFQRYLVDGIATTGLKG